MKRVIGVGLLLAACGTPYGASESPADAGSEASTAVDSGRPAGPLPECKAQRVVHLVGGLGGLAWFTLLWPVPSVIETYDSTYAFDDPKNASRVITDQAHPLYARTVGSETLFQGTGAHPHPSVFVVGMNQAHTMYPLSTHTAAGKEAIGVAALVQQQALAPKVPVVSVTQLTYSAVPGGPLASVYGNLADAITGVASISGLVNTSTLQPDEDTITTWAGTDAKLDQRTLAQGLLFAANAFRQNLIGSLLLPTLEDDPHQEFAMTGTATTDAATLVHILDSFYRELGKYHEPNCGHLGQPLSLADNVVLIVNGDTMKNPFVADSWPDASPGNANLLYVRSNGFLVPGWFGKLTPPSGRQNFDADDGSLSTTTDTITCSDAAVGGLIYAITRGNTDAAASANRFRYQGLISKTPP